MPSLPALWATDKPHASLWLEQVINAGINIGSMAFGMFSSPLVQYDLTEIRRTYGRLCHMHLPLVSIEEVFLDATDLHYRIIYSRSGYYCL